MLIDFLEDPNMNLLILTIYLAIIFFAVEGMAEILKKIVRLIIDPDTKRLINYYEKERKINLQRAKICNADSDLKNGYLEMASQNLEEIKMEIRKREPLRWEGIIIPIVIGVSMTFIFYPVTVFYWLPFKPIYPFDFIITAIIASRGANVAHGGSNKISDFFTALIGRVAGKFLI